MQFLCFLSKFNSKLFLKINNFSMLKNFFFELGRSLGYCKAHIDIKNSIFWNFYLKKSKTIFVDHYFILTQRICTKNQWKFIPYLLQDIKYIFIFWDKMFVTINAKSKTTQVNCTIRLFVFLKILENLTWDPGSEISSEAPLFSAICPCNNISCLSDNIKV